TSDLVRTLAERASRGSQEFSVRPVLPLYLQDEPVQFEIVWRAAEKSAAPQTVKITAFPELEPSNRSVLTIDLPVSQPPALPAAKTKGMWIVEAEVREGNTVRAVYHSGFWVRDFAYLRSGPRLSVNRDYFLLDDHPLAVVGTTYMSSE